MKEEQNLFLVDQELNDLAIGYNFGVDVGIPGITLNPAEFSREIYPDRSLINFLDNYIRNNPYSPYNHNVKNLENPFHPDL